MKLVFLVFLFSCQNKQKWSDIFVLSITSVVGFSRMEFQFSMDCSSFFLSSVFFFSSYLIFPWVVRISCFLSDFGVNEWMIADSNSTWDWHIICIFSYNVFYLLCARISICSSSSSEFRHITKSHLATFSPLPFPSIHSGWQKQTFFVSYLLAIYPVLKHNKFQRIFFLLFFQEINGKSLPAKWNWFVWCVNMQWCDSHKHTILTCHVISTNFVGSCKLHLKHFFSSFISSPFSLSHLNLLKK